jgi:hypothetical protein
MLSLIVDRAAWRTSFIAAATEGARAAGFAGFFARGK